MPIENDTINPDDYRLTTFQYWTQGGNGYYTVNKPPTFTKATLPTSKAAANSRLAEAGRQHDEWVVANKINPNARTPAAGRALEARYYAESPTFLEFMSLHNLLRAVVGYGGG